MDNDIQDHPRPRSELAHILNAPSQQKKPRHRHSPAAIAALNELYDRDEHPALELRTSLAKRLGMEVKTVNAWFQNKRASSKKQRSRGVAAPQRPSSLSSGKGSNTPSQDLTHQTSFDDYPEDDDYPPSDNPYSHNNSVSLGDNSQTVSTFYAGNPDHTHFLVEPDMPRKMRNRPTPEQTEELRKLYNQNPHPSTEQRQLLAQRIGMRYQSITNWFQNQRSLAKKRREDESEPSPDSPSTRQHRGEPTRTFSAFPPPSSHPSLHLPPPSTHPSLGLPPASAPPRSRRSPSVTPSFDEPSPAKRSRRSVTPYSNNAPPLSRPRRTRPEPYQLHALKELSAKTINPSIEARTALALEIGMDLGKVTNWFRNLRQTARKRASKKMGSGDDDYDDNDTESYIALSLPSASVSRSGSPFVPSSSSSTNDMDDSMDLDQGLESRNMLHSRDHSEFDDMSMHDSRHASDDAASDDDYQQEAVTPSPDPSPSPPSPTDIPMPIAMPMQLPSPPKHAHVDVRMVIERPYPAEMNKSTHTSNVKIEDALLLLSFHQHAVH